MSLLASPTEADWLTVITASVIIAPTLKPLLWLGAFRGFIKLLLKAKRRAPFMPTATMGSARDASKCSSVKDAPKQPLTFSQTRK
jgi:hypothetical protein